MRGTCLIFAVGRGLWMKASQYSQRPLLNKVRVRMEDFLVQKCVQRTVSGALFLWQHRTDYNPTKEKRMMRIFNMSVELSSSFENLIMRN